MEIYKLKERKEIITYLFIHKDEVKEDWDFEYQERMYHFFLSESLEVEYNTKKDSVYVCPATKERTKQLLIKGFLSKGFDDYDKEYFNKLKDVSRDVETRKVISRVQEELRRLVVQ